MDKIKAKRAKEIIEDLENLNNYHRLKRLGEDFSHFEFVQNYSEKSPSVRIAYKYNDRFIKIMEDIISELESELEKL